MHNRVNLPSTYSVEAKVLGNDWDNGLGFVNSNPIVEEGCTWSYPKSGSNWTSGSQNQEIANGSNLYIKGGKIIKDKETKIDFELTNFEDTYLKNTIFEDIDFRKARFKGSDLTNVQFINCNLNKVNFSSCIMTGTMLDGVSLKSQKNNKGEDTAQFDNVIDLPYSINKSNK